MLDPNINKRLEILKTAEDLTIAKAAEIYNVSSRTILRWKKKYREGSAEALRNKSKKHQKQPRLIPEKIANEIINLKNKNQEFSAAKIKETLGLSYSLTSIYKKLKEAGISSSALISVKKTKGNKLNPFTIFRIFIFQIKSSSSDITFLSAFLL